MSTFLSRIQLSYIVDFACFGGPFTNKHTAKSLELYTHTYFDVIFMKMLFTSKYFVIFDLSLEVTVRNSVFLELIEPIFAPFAICFVPRCWKLPYSNSLGFTASSTANYGTVISRHVFELKSMHFQSSKQ